MTDRRWGRQWDWWCRREIGNTDKVRCGRRALAPCLRRWLRVLLGKRAGKFMPRQWAVGDGTSVAGGRVRGKDPHEMVVATQDGLEP